jgi:tetratricopeptide (TPR) repeat protein
MDMLRFLLALIAGLAAAASAYGQSVADDDRFCAGTAGTAEQRIAACTRAITSGQLSPEALARTFYNRGIEWSDQRDHDRAISDYTEALRLNPQDASSFYNRGNSWRQKGDGEKAIADYTDALRVNPRHASAYNNRGLAWADRREYDRAIADYTEALRVDPQHMSAYNNRGNAWRDKGDTGRAIADFNEGIRLNPQYALAYNNRGLARTDRREYEAAIADFNEAIRLNPQYANAYSNRGDALGSTGERTRALADYAEAVRLDPRNAARYNRIAWRLAVTRNDQVREGQRAVEYATQACELTSWRVGNYIDTLAAAYAEIGNFTEAVRWEEKSLQDAAFAASRGGEAARARLELNRASKPYRE